MKGCFSNLICLKLEKSQVLKSRPLGRLGKSRLQRKPRYLLENLKTKGLQKKPRYPLIIKLLAQSPYSPTSQPQPLPFAYPSNPRGSSVLSILSAVRAQALTPKGKAQSLHCIPALSETLRVPLASTEISLQR